MPRLIHGTWNGGARLVSLNHQTVQEGWDYITATWYHHGQSVESVRGSYPRFSSITVPNSLGFVIVETEVRPVPRLPGVVAATVRAAGAFAARIFRGGAAIVSHENPSGVRFAAYGVPVNAVFDKTDILICEPSFEVVALDAQPPETHTVGTFFSVDGSPYGGGPFPAVPPSPVDEPFTTDHTIRWPSGWVLQGIEYQQLGVVFLKRYLYGYRHKFSF